MLDLSLSEIGLITVVAILVVDPKDIPAIARTCHKWWRELKSVTDEVKSGIHDILKETGAEDIKNELEQDARNLSEPAPRYIEDQDGKMQRIYDISDLVKEKESVILRQSSTAGGSQEEKLPRSSAALSAAEDDDSSHGTKS